MYRAGLCFSDTSRSFAPRHRWDRLHFGDEMPGIARAATPCDEADGTIAVGHASPPAPLGPATERATDLRYARSGASGEAKATSSLRAKVRRRFCAVPFDARRRQLRVRSPPLHRTTPRSPVVRSTRAHH